MPSSNPFDDIMEAAGIVNNKEYRCITCSYPLEKILVEVLMTKRIRKFFFCRQKKCTRFGTVTVIAK